MNQLKSCNLTSSWRVSPGVGDIRRRRLPPSPLDPLTQRLFCLHRIGLSYPEHDGRGSRCYSATREDFVAAREVADEHGTSVELAQLEGATTSREPTHGVREDTRPPTRVFSYSGMGAQSYPRWTADMAGSSTKICSRTCGSPAPQRGLRRGGANSCKAIGNPSSRTSLHSEQDDQLATS